MYDYMRKCELYRAKRQGYLGIWCACGNTVLRSIRGVLAGISLRKPSCSVYCKP